MVLSWIRYSNVGNRLSGHRLFLLPTIGKIPLNFSVDYASELSSMLFCLNGLCSILGLRRDFIKGLKTHPKGFPIIPHRLTGKTGDQSNKNKKIKEEINQSLHEYFKKLLDESQPFSTYTVRALTKETTRGDVDTVNLPPHFSKRKVYAQWIWERGWKLKYSDRHTSSYSGICDYEKKKILMLMTGQKVLFPNQQ